MLVFVGRAPNHQNRAVNVIAAGCFTLAGVALSHDESGRASCVAMILTRLLHFDLDSVARGVTEWVVGSGALLGWFALLL